MKIGIYYADGLAEQIGATQNEIANAQAAIIEWWTYGLGRSRSYTAHDIGRRDPEAAQNELVWANALVERAFTQCHFSQMPKEEFRKALRGCLDYLPVFDARFSMQFPVFVAAVVNRIKENPRPQWMELI